MCKTVLPLKFLVDADAWQIWGKTKLIFYIFCPLAPCSKKFPAPPAYPLESFSADTFEAEHNV